MTINTRGNKVARPAGDLDVQLERQVRFLKRSCEAFDSGDYEEAVRIATAIRVLVHDTANSHSLLGQLQILDTLSFVDTGVYRSRLYPALVEWVAEQNPDLQIVSTSPVDVGLVEMGDAGDGRVGWFAPLRIKRFAPNSPPQKSMRLAAPFVDWWHDPLVETMNQKTFSRAHLVLIMANQDGGAHVDPQIDADYAALCIDPMFWAEHGPDLEDQTMSGKTPPPVLHNVGFASVRQVAFELLHTLERRQYAAENPGIFVMSEPYAGLTLPTPPHRLLNVPQPIALGKLAGPEQ